MPDFCTREISVLKPFTGREASAASSAFWSAPKSSMAATNISPLMPEPVSRYNFLLTAFSPFCNPVNLGRHVAGTKSIINIDCDDAVRAGIDHRQKRRKAVEAGAIADRCRNGDDGILHEASDDRSKSPFHPGDGDDAVRAPDQGFLGKDPVLLHRTYTIKEGVVINPTLTFDERGHNLNKVYYAALAKMTGFEKMVNPESFCPVTEEFIGNGGNFENPYYVMKNMPLPYKAGEEVDGYETVAAMQFEKVTLMPKQSRTFVVALGYGESMNDINELSKKYLSVEEFDKYLEETKEFWQKKINVSYSSADKEFDNWMHWVNFQPMLRRIYGCSFLPHHDYGKGGRGWRDLWQDCLALLIMEPAKVRGMLIDNFGGVRLDGTNATIIGSKQGEFIADRNNITRVWMDHGAWPYLTTELYIEQSGDIEFLTEKNAYFKDPQVCRGEQKDLEWNDAQGNKQLTNDGEVYEGTFLQTWGVRAAGRQGTCPLLKH